jgi:hypothetical protein
MNNGSENYQTSPTYMYLASNATFMLPKKLEELWALGTNFSQKLVK